MSASSATVLVGDHLEAGDELGIIGSQGGIGGFVCGRGPFEGYKDPPHLHQKVLIRRYYRYLYFRNNDKGDKDDNNEDTTDANVVDPAINPMTLYNRVGVWDT